jgi:hypothetical protein
MTDTFLTTARPQNVSIAWATKDAIFVEIPCENGPPYICRYPKNLTGLAKALNVVLEKPERNDVRTLQKDHPKVTKVPQNASQFTDASREKTRDILKRLKII